MSFTKAIGLLGVGNLIQEAIEISSLEQLVTICRITMDRYFPRLRPFAQRVLGDTYGVDLDDIRTWDTRAFYERRRRMVGCAAHGFGDNFKLDSVRPTEGLGINGSGEVKSWLSQVI